MCVWYSRLLLICTTYLPWIRRRYSQHSQHKKIVMSPAYFFRSIRSMYFVFRTYLLSSTLTHEHQTLHYEYFVNILCHHLAGEETHATYSPPTYCCRKCMCKYGVTCTLWYSQSTACNKLLCRTCCRAEFPLLFSSSSCPFYELVHVIR